MLMIAAQGELFLSSKTNENEINTSIVARIVCIAFLR